MKHKALLAAACALWLTACSLTAQPGDSTPSPHTLRLLALQALSEEPLLQQDSRVALSEHDGQFLLLGQALSTQQIQRAEQIVRQHVGSHTLHNQIRRQSPTTLTTRSHDTWLTGSIKSRLLLNEQINGRQIKVITENSEVFLLGAVTEQQAQQIIDITRNTQGVKRVITVFDYD